LYSREDAKSAKKKLQEGEEFGEIAAPCINLSGYKKERMARKQV